MPQGNVNRAQYTRDTSSTLGEFSIATTVEGSIQVATHTKQFAG
jgi:hypothetical protein